MPRDEDQKHKGWGPVASAVVFILFAAGLVFVYAFASPLQALAVGAASLIIVAVIRALR